MAGKCVYRIVFLNQGKIYEVYARKVGQGTLYGFVEVEDLIFGEKSSVVVDPSEERLKAEFSSVKRFNVPIHAVIRIDEMEKEGVAKITLLSEKSDVVTPFPMPVYTPGSGKEQS